MLVIGRQKEEKTILYDACTGRWYTLLLIDIRGDRIRLGIDADQELRVFRPNTLTPGQRQAYETGRPMTEAELADGKGRRKEQVA